MDKELKHLIYKLNYESLTEDEQAKLDSLLAKNPELSEEVKGVKEMQAGLRKNKRDSFQNGFAERVVEQIISTEKRETNIIQIDSLTLYFRRIAAIAAIFVLICVTYNLKSSDEISFYAAIAVEEDSVEGILDESIIFDME